MPSLIVLSACETGRGKLVAGEGVLGLPRLFLSAGVKTVLMTLWKVDDKFASELMPEFYDYFLNHKLIKVDALAQAKRRLLEKKRAAHGIYYQHPFYWASFSLYGNPGLRQETFFRTIGYVPLLVALIGLIGVYSFCLFIVRKTKTV